MAHLKAHELKEKTRAELLELLASLEKKNFELRCQKSSGSDAKLNEMKDTRRDIARVKTVLMIQQRAALRAKYEGAAHIPKDLRPHTEKSVRQRLAPKYANKKPASVARRAKFLRPVKYALKA